MAETTGEVKVITLPAVFDDDNVEDFGLDWSRKLYDGETIASSTWEHSPELVIGTAENDIPLDEYSDTETKVFFGETSPGVYYLSNKIVTTKEGHDGDFYRKLSIHFIVQVQEFDQVPATEDPGISVANVIEAALTPKRTTTEEGTVEERSISELIEADRYASAKDAGRVPWGMRIAKVKPGGTL